MIPLLFFCSQVVAWLLANKCLERWGGNPKKARIAIHAVLALVTILALVRFTVSIATIQIIAVGAIFLYASYSDIASLEADDYLHIMILLVAFFGRTPADLDGIALSGILLGGFLFLFAILGKTNGIGGADIKFTAACGCLLGLLRGSQGLFIGLLLAVAHNLCKTKKTHQPFPMLPYLSIGFLVAFFL